VWYGRWTATFDSAKRCRKAARRVSHVAVGVSRRRGHHRNRKKDGWSGSRPIARAYSSGVIVQEKWTWKRFLSGESSARGVVDLRKGRQWGRRRLRRQREARTARGETSPSPPVHAESRETTLRAQHPTIAEPASRGADFRELGLRGRLERDPLDQLERRSAEGCGRHAGGAASPAQARPFETCGKRRLP